MSRYDHIIEKSEQELAALSRYCAFANELMAPRSIGETTRQAMRGGRGGDWHSPYFSAPGAGVGRVPSFDEFKGFRPHNQIRVTRAHVKFHGKQAVTVRTTHAYPHPHGEVTRLFREGKVESFQLYSRHASIDYAFGKTYQPANPIELAAAMCPWNADTLKPATR